MDACCVRAVQTAQARTRQRTAKSCGPGAATLASIRPARAGSATGARKAVPRGEHEVSRQTLRGEGRDVPAVPVKAVCVLYYPLHMAMRAQSAPGLPCALFSRGSNEMQDSSEKHAARTMFVVPAKAGTHTPRR